MRKTLFSKLQPLLKPVILLGLIAVLWFGQADAALAARGGRIGGGGFSAPRRSVPTRTYRQPAGGGYGFGGGFGFPFLIPFFGFGGGGGLISLFVMLAIAGFLVRTIRSVTSGEGDGYGGQAAMPKLSVAKVQVGLLADARTLQDDLNRIARSADTSSSAGLAQVLQETTLSLLRHPEYWVYGAAESNQARLDSAEAAFNRMALAERSKFSEETLSNVNNQLRQAEAKGELAKASSGDLAESQPGEYIVATLIVGAEGDLKLPKVTSSNELRQAISQIGSVSGDRLLALEVLWTPQADGDTLSHDDVVINYPELSLV